MQWLNASVYTLISNLKKVAELFFRGIHTYKCIFGDSLIHCNTCDYSPLYKSRLYPAGKTNLVLFMLVDFPVVLFFSLHICTFDICHEHTNIVKNIWQPTIHCNLQFVNNKSWQKMWPDKKEWQWLPFTSLTMFLHVIKYV